MRLLLLASFSAALTLSVTANASTIVGSGGGFSGSGTLTTVSNGDGSYTITAISGASAGVGSLFAPGTFHGNDNQLFPSATTVVDGQGFSFGDTQGNTSYTVDIFSDASSSTGYTAAFLDSDNVSGAVEVTLALSSPSAMALSAATFNPAALTTNYSFSFAPAVATTPEPSTLLLSETGLGIGCFGVLAKLRRRRLNQ
jgi:hypothetical protein